MGVEVLSVVVTTFSFPLKVGDTVEGAGKPCVVFSDTGNPQHVVCDVPVSPVSELRRLIEAIMAGDESKVTATALETLLVDQFFDSKAYEALGEPLALFSPGAGSPYVDGPELRRVIAACEPALRVLYEEGPQT